MKRILLAILALAVVLGTGIFFFAAAKYVGKARNYVYPEQVRAATGDARALHARILVSDLHADSLLWDRDLLERSTWGHVDVPRLLEGNVALQAFSVVTQSPANFNYRGNSAKDDGITRLVIAQRWPIATWGSVLERALFQARKLEDFAARSGGTLALIKSRADLVEYLKARQTNPRITAGWLTLEGAHALEGNITNLDRLHDLGYRMIAPSHLFDSSISGSSTGEQQGGLTPLGREWVTRMEEKQMIIDLAHASSQAIDDVLKIATRPIIISHTGVIATCDSNRNVSDDQLLRIARTGGLVGIGFWQHATCGRDLGSIVRAIRHAVRVIGDDHVALGSDFDGSVATPIDVSQMSSITSALLQDGFTEAQVSKIMGGNVIRVLLQVLP